jgi:nicotinate-nucleotide pyrophosphorylase (carboxylating)
MIPIDNIAHIIELAYNEDIGSGDYSSISTISPTSRGKVQLFVKENGVLAGVEVAKAVCNYFSNDLHLEIFLSDGVEINKGDIVFYLSGYQLDLLKVERTLLNFMQRMSGIATETRRYVKRLDGLKTKILDTRKTTPGLRTIEKAAVKIGGGTNHRSGLFDMIMLKDNHIDFCGGIENAINNANDYIKKNNITLQIEVETRTLADIEKVLQNGGIQRIMFDNFSIEDTKQAVKLVNSRYETESSGGITYKNIRDYAECGVDFISVGALTHHIKSLDLSLKRIG